MQTLLCTFLKTETLSLHPASRGGGSLSLRWGMRNSSGTEAAAGNPARHSCSPADNPEPSAPWPEKMGLLHASPGSAEAHLLACSLAVSQEVEKSCLRLFGNLYLAASISGKRQVTSSQSYTLHRKLAEDLLLSSCPPHLCPALEEWRGLSLLSYLEGHIGREGASDHGGGKGSLWGQNGQMSIPKHPQQVSASATWTSGAGWLSERPGQCRVLAGSLVSGLHHQLSVTLHFQCRQSKMSRILSNVPKGQNHPQFWSTAIDRQTERR